MALLSILTDKASKKIDYPDFAHPIFLHDDLIPLISAENSAEDRISRKLNLEITNLAALGRPSLKKGCRDVTNRGWQRTPIAGNHQYLWWTHQGTKHLAGLDLPRNAIVVRAVRHHDNHDPLRVGDKSKLMEWKHRDQNSATQPWTEDQKKFLADEAQVRILQGNPGSGKTTALWQAVSARDEQTVVYLTWSRKLAQAAEQFFKSFAGKGVKLYVRDFRSFWGDLLGRDLPSVDARESKAIFLNNLSLYGAAELGVWSRAKEELYAEVRAEVYGRGNPLDTATPLGRLDRQSYIQKQRSELGEATKDPVRIVENIEQNLKPSQWIPELEAASQAARLIKSAGPGVLLKKLGLAKIDRIVIDEVQDLTQLEFQSLMFLYDSVAREQERLPFLLIAGDEGQTVVPTHFKWGNFKDLVYSSMQGLVEEPTKVVSEHKLFESLRCPRNVCQVLDKVSGLYGKLPKGMKPGDQTPPSKIQIYDGRVIHSVAKDLSEAESLLEKLSVREGFAVLQMDEAGIREELADKILTPSEAKGLEYQSVCLINPGRSISKIKALANEADKLGKKAARTAIDELRVALSRTTGDLVFLDVNPQEEDLEESKKVLDNPIETDVHGLEAFFDDIDDTPEQRVEARIRLARSLEESDLRRAWRLALEGWRMLGSVDLTNGVSDTDLRREVLFFVLRLGSRLVVREINEQSFVSDAIKQVQAVVQEPEVSNAKDILDKLLKWQDSSRRGLRTIQLLQSIVDSSGETDWVEPVLSGLAQTIRQGIISAAEEAQSAALFIGPVARWLELTGQSEGLIEREVELREVAFETLLKARHLDSALAILKHFPSDYTKNARWNEAAGNHEESARLFEQAGSASDALRNWRNAGNWEMAVRLANEDEIEKFQWLGALNKQMLSKPKGLDDWLTVAERKRMMDLLNKNNIFKIN